VLKPTECAEATAVLAVCGAGMLLAVPAGVVGVARAVGVIRTGLDAQRRFSSR
jgi:hypothetical protein